MSCNTCGHTMQMIGTPDGVAAPVYWCPRCGTLKAADPGLGTDQVEAPKLVGRCRRILDGVRPGESVEIDAGTLDRLGITESIYPPEDRPRA